jgi:subtilisin-like proprotein convertase family protein
MPIRNTGYIDDATIEQLFSWAANQGADVICCSWGVGAIYFPLSLRQRLAIHRAATEGREGKGCVITFAAGNANRPISGEIEEIGWSQANVKGKTTWLNGFAVHPDVIAVAACTSLGRKAAYSNWGKQIAIAAPSNNAPPGAWLPNVGEVLTGPPVTEILKGRGIFTSDRMASLGYALGNFTDNFGGTSSACPVVAGVAALVLSVNPDLTAAEVKELLQRTADKLVDPTPDPQLKLRKGTYSAQGHSEWLGYGKVNAARAVQEALRLRPAPQAATTEIQRRHQTAMSIPDDDAVGIQSQIVINDNQEIRALEVWVDIEHSFLGDLEIYLVPPQRSAILLQGRTLGRQTQLQTTYSITTTPNLSQMLGQPAQGRWQLWIRDRAPQNTGQLNQWQLTIGF